MAPSAFHLEMALRFRNARRTIRPFFPLDLFINSAWDMVLELFIAHARERQLCVKELILISGESSSSAMRRIDGLQTAGFLARHNDPRDQRRVLVALTAKAYTLLVLMFEQFADEADDGPAIAKSFAPRATDKLPRRRGSAL